MINIIFAILAIIISLIILVVFFSNNAVKRADRHAKLRIGYEKPFIQYLLNEIKSIPNSEEIIARCHERATKQFQTQFPNDKNN